MTPRVSVVIPVFNGARYLGEAITSVLSQTWDTSEIIVIDDGSTDSSADVAGRFGRAITYVYQPNQGAGAARNRGVQLSTGEYLAFLDQDDIWARDKLACQMDAFTAHPSLDMVFGHVQQFYSPDWPEARRLKLHCPRTPVPGYLPSALLIKRESFLRVAPFGTHWQVAEWADWYVRAREEGLAAATLPSLVAWRRLHEHNQGLTARTSAQEYAQIVMASLHRRRRHYGAGDVISLRNLSPEGGPRI